MTYFCLALGIHHLPFITLDPLKRLGVGLQYRMQVEAALEDKIEDENVLSKLWLLDRLWLSVTTRALPLRDHGED